MDKTYVINELKLKNSCINNNDECSICYERYTKIQNIYMLDNCKHLFCKTCIFEQMNIDKYKNNIICPLCRTNNSNVKFINNNDDSNNTIDNNIYNNNIITVTTYSEDESIINVYYFLIVNDDESALETILEILTESPIEPTVD